MGEGYWVWIIPLAGDKTSIGIVVHDEVHTFDKVRTLEHAKSFIRQHEPILADVLENREVLDFGCLHGYSHNIGRAYSHDRWAAVGDAAARLPIHCTAPVLTSSPLPTPLPRS